MTRFLTVPAGRRAKWIVLAVCLLVLFGSVAANLPGKFADAEKNESTLVPARATPSRRRRSTISEELQGGEQAPIVIVYRREGGLTAADRRADPRRPRGAQPRDRAQNEDDIYRAASPVRASRASPSPATPRC